jgi:UDP-glucuronate 4-epimerase
MKHKILITGTAGFIGYHLTIRLAEAGYNVVGLDNINDYYDVELKYGRLAELGIFKEFIIENESIQSSRFSNLKFCKSDLKDKQNLDKLFAEENFTEVINLAAQAGVRFSIENPTVYIESNVHGFLNILEACRHHPVSHLVYASSSSVYGLNDKLPFSTQDNVDHPISIYAATKKSNELMAHVYSHLFALPTTGLRFFTVYGPWGRPDMAPFLFTKSIIEGNPVKVFNNGDMMRDFTYIDDIIDGILGVLFKVPEATKNFNGKNPEPSKSKARYKLFNIGNNTPVNLLDFIKIIEEYAGKKADMVKLPMQPGDVYATFADIAVMTDYSGFIPKTDIKSGMKKFIDWYKEFYSVIII